MWKLLLAAAGTVFISAMTPYYTNDLAGEIQYGISGKQTHQVAGFFVSGDKKRGSSFQKQETHIMAAAVTEHLIAGDNKQEEGGVSNADTGENISFSAPGTPDTTKPEATLTHANSTASKNVHIVDTAFYIPQLNRHRRIWIYLPQGYATSLKKYPVFYMQDGQNVFDEATSFAGEWGIDEALDTLDAADKQAIVVAIDNGGNKRINEYSPYDMDEYGKGEGDLYLDFLVHTLKPYIDRQYRTLHTRKNTFIAGSSLGGLISFYALLKYPKVFGGAGIFSPAFWIAPSLKNDIEKRGSKVKSKIYFYAGKKESEKMVPDMLAVFNQLHSLSKADMTTVIREEGKHSETTWRHEFPLFYKWMMNSH